jgi:hypothetical protein
MPTTEERITQLEEQQKQIEVARANKPPYYLELQLKKNKQRLQRMDRMQKETFKSICKKDGIHKTDWYDEFILYWTGFLKGEYKSINQYLQRKNFNS